MPIGTTVLYCIPKTCLGEVQIVGWSGWRERRVRHPYDRVAFEAAAGASCIEYDGTPRVEGVQFLYSETPMEGCDLVPYVVIHSFW